MLSNQKTRDTITQDCFTQGKIQYTPEGIQIRGKQITREGLQDYMRKLMNDAEWSHGHSENTLISILSLQWMQERPPAEPEKLGNMRQLSEEIPQNISTLQDSREKEREQKRENYVSNDRHKRRTITAQITERQGIHRRSDCSNHRDVYESDHTHTEKDLSLIHI